MSETGEQRGMNGNMKWIWLALALAGWAVQFGILQAQESANRRDIDELRLERNNLYVPRIEYDKRHEEMVHQLERLQVVIDSMNERLRK